LKRLYIHIATISPFASVSRTCADIDEEYTEATTFYRPPYVSETDKITDTVAISRNDYEELIYNSFMETSSDTTSDSSPFGTFWSDVYSTNLQRFSTFFSMACEFDCASLTGKTVAMVVQTAMQTEFHKIDFLEYYPTSGGMRYTRRLTHACAEGQFINFTQFMCMCMWDSFC
jgi:hypothetical protein